MSKHHPAAFINTIAEEGTKDEAIEWLQTTWNDLCEVRALNKKLLEALQMLLNDRTGFHTHSDAVNNARAVIAEAKGEQWNNSSR